MYYIRCGREENTNQLFGRCRCCCCCGVYTASHCSIEMGKRAESCCSLGVLFFVSLILYQARPMSCAENSTMPERKLSYHLDAFGSRASMAGG